MSTPRTLGSDLDAVVFDLDGTLWDTCDSCAVAWNRVVKRCGIQWRPITGDDVRKVAGKPHDLCIRESFPGLSPEQLQALTAQTQTEDNLIIGELGGALYPGVPEGLRALRERFGLFIVSNCQAGYIETFYATSGLQTLFSDAECWGNTGRTKAENLQALIARNRLTAPIFIGDTEGDRQAARACSVPFVHVRYGFAQCEGVEWSVSAFAELVTLLLA